MSQETHILMVGPSRSGKTSIIAALRNLGIRAGNAFQRYGITFEEYPELNKMYGEDLGLTYDNMYRISRAKTPFLSALFGTQGVAKYYFGLDFNAQGEDERRVKKMDFVFHDVPGEFYMMNDAESIKKLEDLTADCSVMIIAVDYPALKLAEYFQDSQDLSTYLRTFICDEALQKLLPKMGQNLRKDSPKLIIIVPIKCEATMQDEEETKEMYNRIQEHFSPRLESITAIGGEKKNLKILTMPLQTIGNVYASRNYDEDPHLCVFDDKEHPVKWHRIPNPENPEDSIRSNEPLIKKVKLGQAIKGIRLDEDVRLMDSDGEDHYISRCSAECDGVITLHNGETYQLEEGDQIIGANEFHDLPYSIREGYAIPYIWYYADTNKKFSPHNEDQLLMELMKFFLQDFAFAIGKTMDEILNYEESSSFIDIIFEALRDFFSGRSPISDESQLKQMVKVVKEMNQKGEFKNEFQVLYNTLDSEGPLKI